MLNKETVEKIIGIQEILADNMYKYLYATYTEKFVPPYVQKEFSFNSIVVDEMGAYLVNVFEGGSSRYDAMLNIEYVESIHIRDNNKTRLL